MKIAIIHDWLVVNAGAEKVLKAIASMYPNADIFSLVDFLSFEDREDILNGKFAKTTFIQKLPFAKKYFRYYLPLFPKAIESFDLKKYNLIISSSWAVAKGIKKHNKQTHFCYCHTPIRYAWDLNDEYTRNLIQPKKLFVELSLKYIKKWDIETLDRVDYFLANSNNVAQRIKRIYNRDSKIIYPPIDKNKFKLQINKKDYFLTVSRLVPYKKIKLIVEAFNEMPKKHLIIIGQGEEFEAIKKIAKDNIVLLGYQPDEVVIKYMQEAKAFVNASIEDFGIAPIEAMACGTPVIALKQGGTAETVIDGVNGIYFKKQTKEDIIKSVKRFDKLDFECKQIRNSIERFLSFDKDFQNIVFEYFNQNKNKKA